LRRMYATYCRVVGEFDLWLLKKLGKKIYVTFQGDDARIGEYCKQHFAVHFYPYVSPGYYTKESDERKKRLIELWDKYADEIFYLNPDLGWVLPRRSQFFPYGHVDFESLRPQKSQNSVTKIIHAPTHREVKGTDFLIKAVDNLRTRGRKFDLELVEAKPFREALQIYGSGDIIVDQLLAGWYGGFAVEAMALGKPVIAYIRDEDLTLIPEEMRADLPVVCASPSDLAEKIDLLLASRLEREALGRKGREFVLKWHSPKRHLQRLYKDSDRNENQSPTDH